MFLKQTAFKPRSGSGSAGSDSAANTNNAASADLSTAAQRRRSSTSEKFAGLTAHKRTSQDGSVDRSVLDKKAGFADQKPGSTGMLGNMWNSFTKGT